MSNLDGVPYYDSTLGDVAVPAAVAPLGTPPNGSFPSMRTSCIIGSPKLLSDVTSRDNIPAGLRAEGMIAFVQSTGLTYQLQGGIANVNWVALSWSASTLAAVLAAGNTTGGNNILTTSGDEVRGNPGATGAALTLRGGASSGAAVAGGTASLIGGTPVEGAGGSIAITGAAGVTATATARNGGSIVITPGAAAAAGTAGTIQLSGTTDLGPNVLRGGTAIGTTDVGLLGGTQASAWLVTSGTSTTAYRDLGARTLAVQSDSGTNGFGMGPPGATNPLANLDTALRRPAAGVFGLVSHLQLASTGEIAWTSGVLGATATQDVGLVRNSAGVLTVTNGQSTNRKAAFGGSVALTDAVATTVITVAQAAGARTGGQLRYSIDVSDGTDFQVLTGQIAWSALDKTGTLTTNVDSTLANQSLALSSASTLSITWTVSDGANAYSLQCNADTSLAGATLTIRFNADLFGSAVTFS